MESNPSLNLELLFAVNGALYFPDGSAALIMPMQPSIAPVNPTTGSISSRASRPTVSDLRSWGARVRIDGEFVPLIETGPEAPRARATRGTK
jgi:hypothetical protein